MIGALIEGFALTTAAFATAGTLHWLDAPLWMVVLFFSAAILVWRHYRMRI